MSESMYLIFETNGRPVKAIRTTLQSPLGRLDSATIRAALESQYPGRTILSPLERPAGPVQVVTIYVSRERSGLGRLGTMQQWGVV